MQKPGTPITVQSVDVKSDRIEFRCQANGISGDDGYVKLKLMLGTNPADQSPKQVEILLNRALLIPRVDQEQRAVAFAAQIDDEITAVENRLQSEDPERAVIDTSRLIALYKQKRGQQTLISPNLVAATDQHLALLNSQLAGLEKSADADRVARTRRAFTSALDTASVACNAVSSAKFYSAADLGSAQAAVDAATRGLNELGSRDVSESDPAAVSAGQLLRGSCSVTISSLQSKIAFRQKELQVAQQRQEEAVQQAQQRQELEAQQAQRRRELADLNGAYEKLRELQKRLDQRLAAEFGSSPAADTNAAYRELLQQMYKNRQAAAQLGDTAAATKMQEIEHQYQKLM